MEAAYTHKIEELASLFEGKDKELILSSFEVARGSLEGMARDNRRPFIEHPLGVALIVAKELNLMAEAVAAVFLHEATRVHPELLATLHKTYSAEIMTMVEGLNNISKITPKETRLQAENYRKLIVSYSLDPRVTLLKLADRLEVMRNLEMFPKSSIIQKLTETQMLYIPLAHQLGLYNIKSQMENLFFKYSDPENFRAITNNLIATQGDREKLVAEFIKPLEEKLRQAGIKYTLKVRTKTAWSIWQKMQRQGIPFQDVYDVFAIRFILDVPPQEERACCWKVYSLVTQEYTPDVSRLRDWITNPKPNGYESLHTTVENGNGARIEVQIRTVRMDQIAENGHASHWSYKGIKSVHGLDEWLSSVKKVLETPGLISQPGNTAELNEIFVFTPNGDLKKLPKGASVLDFAFAIHTKLGMTCSGAKVNGKVKSIRDQLHTGDTVEIMSSKNQKPSKDWLNYVVSARARHRIRVRIAEIEEKEREREGYAKSDKEAAGQPAGGGREAARSSTQITDTPLSQQELIEKNEQAAKRLHTGKDFLVISDKIDNISFKMAKCCNPIFGDEVFGFVTSSGAISIHRISCPNAGRLLTAYPYRIQKVKWRPQPTTAQFQTRLKVIGNGDAAISNKIMQSIVECGASVRAFRISERKKSKLEFVAEMEISVGSNAHLDKVTSTLKKLREVTTILRSK